MENDMEPTGIAIDPILLTYVAQTLGRVPENLYDFQKIKNLACGGKPVYQKLIDPLHDPVPERFEIVRGDFSVIGKMSRVKKLTILRKTDGAEPKEWGNGGTAIEICRKKIIRDL